MLYKIIPGSLYCHLLIIAHSCALYCLIYNKVKDNLWVICLQSSKKSDDLHRRSLYLL